jgi:hypothetical protein
MGKCTIQVWKAPTYQERLTAVIAAKLRGVNTYVN